MRYQTHILTSVTAALALTQYTDLDPTIGMMVGVTIGSLLPDVDEDGSYAGRRSMGVAKVIKSIFGHRGFTHSILATLLIFIPYFLLKTHNIPGLNLYHFDIEKYNLLHLIISGGLTWVQLTIIGLITAYLIHISGDIFGKVIEKLFVFLTTRNRKRMKLLLYGALIILSILLPFKWLNTVFLGIGMGYLFHILGDMFSNSGVPLFWFFTEKSKKRIRIPLYTTGQMGEKIIFALTTIYLIYTLKIMFF